MQGYIKLHRQLLEWEWYKNIPVRIIFEHCLLKANHKDKKWQGQTITKGSFITSYENLAFETGLTVQQVRTAISKLKSTGEITYKSTSQYSIISINNWEEYQEDNTQSNKQITSEQQTNNKQITTTKNVKNDKNDKNNIKQEKENFDLFFNSYPLKTDEYKTYQIFSAIINEKEATEDELIEGAKRYKRYCARAGTDPRFIKSPFNWLKDMSWKNKYEVKNDTPYNAFSI